MVFWYDLIAPMPPCGVPVTPARGIRAPPGQTSTVTGRTFQIWSQYSAIARSDENVPLRAVFKIDIRVQASVSRHAAPTLCWQST